MFLGQPVTTPIALYDALGAPLTGLTFSGAEIQLSINGAALTNALGVSAELGHGLYTYMCTVGEVSTLGKILLVVRKTGAQPNPYLYEIDVLPASTVSELLDTVMFPNADEDNQHTFAEAFRLLCAEKFGNARGLDGPIGSHDAIGESKHALEWTYFSGTRTLTKRDGSE